MWVANPPNCSESEYVADPTWSSQAASQPTCRCLEGGWNYLAVVESQSGHCSISVAADTLAL
eukprot:39876-Pyramimonas_sp.AAC.1